LEIGRMMTAARLILFAHGSADPQWREPFESLQREVRRARGDGAVRLCYMEFSAPTLLDAADEAVRDGVGRLRILPLFMAGGAHLSRDLPAQADRVRERYPDLQVEVLAPVGEDPRVRALLRDLALEASGPAG
jgi:sirohydrochlorin cobaltochelatase